MLRKRQRLTVAAFNTYFKTGKRHQGTYVQLVYHPADTFHGAVVVGKKVYKTAVARNRLRRQLYSVLFATKADIERGVFIVLVKPAARDVSVDLVREELRALLAQVTSSR